MSSPEKPEYSPAAVAAARSIRAKALDNLKRLKAEREAEALRQGDPGSMRVCPICFSLVVSLEFHYTWHDTLTKDTNENPNTPPTGS